MLIIIAEAPLTISPSAFIEHVKNFTQNSNFLIILIKTKHSTPMLEREIETLSTESLLKGGEVITVQNPGAQTSIENIILERKPEKILIYAFFKPTYRKIKTPYYFSKLKNKFNTLEIQLISIPISIFEKPLLSQYPKVLTALKPFGTSFLFALGNLFLGYLLSLLVGYKAIGSIFLLTTLIYSFRSTFAPILLFSFSTFFGWYLLLVPKNTTNHISSAEDLIFFIVSLSVGCLIASLVYRVKKREDFLWQHQRSLRFLYEITTDIANSQNLEACMALIFPKIKEHLNGEVAVILKKEDSFIPLSLNRGWWLRDKQSMELAKWSFENVREVGLSTNFYPYSSALFIPMQGADGVVGTLSFKPLENKFIKQDTKTNLYAIAHQLGLFIERDMFLENFKKTILLEESEKLHQTIFNSLSHELKTPIMALSGYTDILIKNNPGLTENKQKEIFEDVKENVWRLNQIVTNLLDSSRIHSGRIQPNLDWYDPLEIIEFSVDNHRLLQSNPYTISCPEDLPPIYVDFGLIVHCMENLITNAVLYGKGKNITIGATIENQKNLSFFVSDEGEGIDKMYHKNLFDRFYRVPGSPAGGSGLGLFLIKQVVDLHGGHVKYIENTPRGAKFMINLPIKEMKE